MTNNHIFRYGIYSVMGSDTEGSALIIFLKYPEPGKVKTRLARDIGNEMACMVYKRLAEDTVKNMFLASSIKYDIYVYFTPGWKGEEVKNWLKPVICGDRGLNIYYMPQAGDSLGERMLNAFRYILCAGGYKRGVIVGTDCPEISPGLIENAFAELQEKDAVIGPCRDGGYYLLGLSVLLEDLFLGIDWGTGLVFDQTVERIHKSNLLYAVLKTLNDVDTVEDLHYLQQSMGCKNFGCMGDISL